MVLCLTVLSPSSELAVAVVTASSGINWYDDFSLQIFNRGPNRRCKAGALLLKPLSLNIVEHWSQTSVRDNCGDMPSLSALMSSPSNFSTVFISSWLHLPGRVSAFALVEPVDERSEPML